MTPKKTGPWRRWVVNPIMQQLTQGTTPAKISQAIAYGITLGIFPIIGSNTLLTLLAGVPLKLNQPILQAFKTLAYPLQWALILGFYRAGEWLFNAPHVSIHIPSMIERFFAEPIPFFKDYGMTALYGIAVWCLVAPVLMAVIYFSSKPLIEHLATRNPLRPSTP
ncbi:hypothetical protein EI77_01591 [Prosthecobacter fusiformis]|uniref:DUF2062 domain-containing protein n=1 Tax=Prosthecobacter fusiformis TaxID=48464 RepID=A0A4V6Q5G3_9BACT|nr:DUF2062 domain-containing protein [Prosthecobacter fusiformis]TDU73123.1 hypothetical protein EI77_01591 [Prosthecobacter fusiformis]